MKLVIHSDTGDRIVRYGASDFDTGDDTVIVFYPPDAIDNGAPNEERISGTVTAGIDGADFSDPALRDEDYHYEQSQADDIEDYR